MPKSDQSHLTLDPACMHAHMQHLLKGEKRKEGKGERGEGKGEKAA